VPHNVRSVVRGKARYSVAMSEKNVERVRDYLEGYGRRNPEEAEWVEEYWDPEGDFYPVRKFPESRPRHSKEEISRLAADWRAGWDRLESRSGRSSRSATIASWRRSRSRARGGRAARCPKASCTTAIGFATGASSARNIT
jgi:hypothetical protein